jgi:PAS domain S-box-containing protein
MKKVIKGRKIPGKESGTGKLGQAKRKLERNLLKCRRTEETLRKSEDKCRYIFEHSPVGESVTFPSGEIHVNKTFCDMTGYSAEELQNRKWQNITHPDDIDATDKFLHTLLSGKKESVRFIKRYIHKNGSVIWADVSTSLRRDPENQPLYFVTAMMDITERKLIEETLHRHTERLHNLHEVDQAILSAVQSPEEIVQMTLGHIRSLLSCRRASIGIFDSGMKELQIFAAEDNKKAIAQIRQDLPDNVNEEIEVLRHGKADIIEDMSLLKSSPALIRIFQADGQLSCLNVPLVTSNKLVGALILGWDKPRVFTKEELEIAHETSGHIAIAIEQAQLRNETKRHAAELEERIRERTAQLETANKELETFSYSVSHDLRAPLRTVDGYVRILLEDFSPVLNDEGKRICSVISESARNMGRLIDDLLDFSRIGRVELQLSSIDMAALAHSVFFELTTPGDRERIDFHIDPLPYALGDPTLIRQVWMNLLGNAVKFSSKKERAVIKVGAEQQGAEAVYSVRDNGAGFDMRYSDKLFNVFQRLHSTREFEGTGVGLAIVKRIVLRHAGRVRAEGNKDQGAVFYFSIKNGG